MTELIHCERCGKMVGYGGGIIVDECGCRAADASKDLKVVARRKDMTADAEKADEPFECIICGRIDGVRESYCSWCFGKGARKAIAEKAGTCERCGYDVDSLYHRHDCVAEARKQGKSASKLLHIRLTISRLPSPLLPLRELLARDFELDEADVPTFVRFVKLACETIDRKEASS